MNRWLAMMVAACAVIQPVAANPTDPVRNLSRVRLIVTTAATSADVTVTGATVASYLSTVRGGAPAVRTSQTGSTLRLSRNVAGQSAEASFDMILADVSSRGLVTWNLALGSVADAQLEVYSLAEFERPRLVDRFEATGTSSRFSTPAVQLTPGAVSATTVPRLVLAHYYPWYTIDTWSDPQMADSPLRAYSSDRREDVDEQARQAVAAGIDAFVVSWQGKEAGNGFNVRRMQLVLEAARQAGLKACIYTETYVANVGNDPRVPIDPDVVFDWFVDIVDMFGDHPAYLRLDGRPVILMYAVSLLPQAQWDAVLARLRATGRNPVVIGEFFQSTLLETFDGEYQYTNVLRPPDEVSRIDRVESLRVRTFHLLRPRSPRRIWIASVTPGFDDTKLIGREGRLVDRANGRVYDEQWDAAVSTAADWVVVTSWNEWWENTQIEPSVRYGSAFLDRTRDWATAFKSGSGVSALSSKRVGNR
ncbi:MAG: glycoside hydrolase family 99-like domain-containing protein [Vicinamibacterales bacterium]